MPNQYQHRQNSGQFSGQQRPPWKGNKNQSGGSFKTPQPQQDYRQGSKQDQKTQMPYTQPGRIQQSNRGGFSGSSRIGNSQQTRSQGIHIQTRGPCYTCGGMGHIARDCPQRPASNYQKGATSEPTVGDMGKSHRVFAAVDNH